MLATVLVFVRYKTHHLINTFVCEFQNNMRQLPEVFKETRSSYPKLYVQTTKLFTTENSLKMTACPKYLKIALKKINSGHN